MKKLSINTKKVVVVDLPDWPEPTMEEPSLDDLYAAIFDSVVDATDGCRVEPDGMCEHGHPSWFIYLEVI